MKTVVMRGAAGDVSVSLDGDRLRLVAPTGQWVEASRADLGRALADLDAQVEVLPPAEVRRWVPLAVGGIGHNRACRYRVGVARGGERAWSEWRHGHLHAETREYDVPKTHRDQTRYWRAGEPASVGIVGSRSAIGEYTPDELGDDGVFSADAGDRQLLLQVEVPG